MHDLSFRALHAGSIAILTDVGCRAREGGRSAEEVSASDEVVFLRAGAFIKHVGSTDLLADTGHVVFFNRGEPYRVSHPVTAGDESTAFGFPREVLVEAFGGTTGAEWRFPLTHCPIGPSVSLAMQGLRRHLDGGGPASSRCGLAAEELSLDLLRAVARAVRRRQGLTPPAGLRATRRRRAIVEETRHILGRSYRESTSLAAIASRVGASPYHLTRIFREETGAPLHRYRVLLRLREALERLSGGEGDLTALALNLGYSSHSHFTDSFRAAFGMSPSDFRRRPAPIAFRALRKILEA